MKQTCTTHIEAWINLADFNDVISSGRNSFEELYIWIDSLVRITLPLVVSRILLLFGIGFDSIHFILFKWTVCRTSRRWILDYIIGGFVSIFPRSFVQGRYPHRHLGTWSRSRQLNRQQSTLLLHRDHILCWVLSVIQWGNRRSTMESHRKGKLVERETQKECSKCDIRGNLNCQ